MNDEDDYYEFDYMNICKEYHDDDDDNIDYYDELLDYYNSYFDDYHDY
jgi:hypothetical protein